jgi:hypothetical protein
MPASDAAERCGLAPKIRRRLSQQPAVFTSTVNGNLLKGNHFSSLLLVFIPTSIDDSCFIQGWRESYLIYLKRPFIQVIAHPERLIKTPHFHRLSLQIKPTGICPRKEGCEQLIVASIGRFHNQGVRPSNIFFKGRFSFFRPPVKLKNTAHLRSESKPAE